MAHHKTFFGKLFGWIGDIFENAAKRLWDNLTSEEQASLKHGSGVISIINQHLTDTQEAIKTAIEETFPDLQLAKLEQALLAVCLTFGIKPPTLDINGTIEGLQQWLSEKENDKVWRWASSAAAELLAVTLTPNTTVFEKVSVLIQWVYDTFIKKD